MVTRRGTLGMMGAAGIAATPLGRLAAAPGAWRPLFNGRNFDGWTFFQDGIGNTDRDNVAAVEGGMLHIFGPRYRGPAAAPMGYLATAEAYGDYHLSLEYKWGERRFAPRELWKRDSGILYHVPAGREFLWPDCVEYQIMERSTGDAIPVNHRAIPGVSMGGLPAWPRNFPGQPYAPQIDAGGNLRQMIRAEGSFDTLDGWNTVELIASGDSAAHIVNGRIVNTLYGLQARDAAGAYAPITRGRILLQIECAEIRFRNIRIRSL
jgi:hypothetical protein